MNTVANGRLRSSGIFDELWAQPMASDSGLALGAALWVHGAAHPRQERWRMTSPYLGSAITDVEVEALLGRKEVQNWFVEHAIACYRPINVAADVADLLAAGNLVGWARGRAEVGARALGHRSIFADPRAPETCDRLNRLIKLREAWRPFSPIVRHDAVTALFETPGQSTYMMFVSQAQADAPIPAALHVDGSARLQTVEIDGDPDLLALLTAFEARTGVAALVNTSLNTRGEPIVRTAAEALAVFQRSGMNALVLGPYLLNRGPDSPPNVAPLAPPPRPIEIAPEILACMRAAEGTVLLSVAADEAAEVARDALQGLGGPSPLLVCARRELFEPKGRTITVGLDIPEASVIVAMLPVWVEAAAELVPGIIATLVTLLDAPDSPTVLLADEQGGWADLAKFAADGTRPGLYGFAPPSEAYWLTRLDTGGD